ncbi:hypothetical protein JIR001_14840 [Polycladomyces abyssicola]|uniref:Uncharacterized protein n=1 Tax=Polycladomyces abyssicola TaxID=1125966 RepID=A0A8D5UE10_9BACL|nr:hypothetical protein JIR001_14840 [Polycladomyces abyssicola]
MGTRDVTKRIDQSCYHHPKRQGDADVGNAVRQLIDDNRTCPCKHQKIRTNEFCNPFPVH